jgi:OOP family OmpA-OmpF porin
LVLNLRTAAALLVLIGGVATSVRLDTGRNESEAELAVYSAAEPATFEVSLRRGTLTLTGNTVSDRHEEQLRQAAVTNFPGTTLRADFRPLGVAPDWWNSATTELLAALPTIQSPTAVLQADQLQVSGVVANQSVAELRLQTLRKTLPDSATFEIRLQSAAMNTTARAVCERQFSVFETGPVNFEESGTEFLSSAYPALDRVVALADACRHSTLLITGHTDSSGDETWNQQLSLERARAVATYLGTMGIDPERMVVVAAGSSSPVASNATRYGRGLNRRIDIYMTSGRPD